jgi:hypothetical protein
MVCVSTSRSTSVLELTTQRVAVDNTLYAARKLQHTGLITVVPRAGVELNRSLVRFPCDSALNPSGGRPPFRLLKRHSFFFSVGVINKIDFVIVQHNTT